MNGFEIAGVIFSIPLCAIVAFGILGIVYLALEEFWGFLCKKKTKEEWIHLVIGVSMVLFVIGLILGIVGKAEKLNSPPTTTEVEKR
jgi:hypothetical protein